MATKPSKTRRQIHLAVLIDADNAPAAIVEGLFEEIAKYGVASVKRIYGDWTKPNLGSWKKVLLDYSIQTIQQFAYTSGKNATDSSLIIDAMDLLYTRRFDGFCLVSSDSDFIRLASRLREEGRPSTVSANRRRPRPSSPPATNSSTPKSSVSMHPKRHRSLRSMETSRRYRSLLTKPRRTPKPPTRAFRPNRTRYRWTSSPRCSPT